MGIHTCPSTCFGVFFAPELPRRLLKKGRFNNTYQSLLRMRNTQLQAARDFYIIYVQLEVEIAKIQEAGFGHSKIFTRFLELFTVPRNRRAAQASGMHLHGCTVVLWKYVFLQTILN